MEHKIRDSILKKLMHNPGLLFNELCEEEKSNKFSYHLKLMEEEGLIEKQQLNKYFLSSEGKALAVFIDGSTGKKEKQPLINVVMVVYNDNGNILLHHRLKEPFYDYYGFPGAKIKFGEEISECAKRELKEETNLEADVELMGIMNCHTFNNGKIAYHHNQYIFKCTNPKGELKKEDREGTFEWASKEEVLSKNLFPDDPFILERIEKGLFFNVEMDRFQDNDKFGKIKIKSISEYKKI